MGLQEFKLIHKDIHTIEYDTTSLHLIASNIARDINGDFGPDATEVADIWTRAKNLSLLLLKRCDAGHAQEYAGW